MPSDLTDDKTILVQVMAWHRQASHYITWAKVDPDLWPIRLKTMPCNKISIESWLLIRPYGTTTWNSSSAWWWVKILNIIQWDQSIIATSNGSWRQGIKGETTCTVYWPAHRAGLLRCNFFGQPGSVSKFPPFLWVKLWVGWVGRGYIEISRYFPALWINRVTLVTKIKLWHSLGYQITYESPKCLYGMLFCVSKPDSIFSVFHSSPSSHVSSSLIGWSFILGNTDCNTVPTWWM